MIGIQDIKKVEKEEEAVEDSKEEMILGRKKMWKDLEKEMAIRVNRNKEILGEIEGDIEMEDIEVKGEIEEVIEEIAEIEEIEAIDITIDKTVNQGNNVNPDKTVNLDSATKIPTPQAYTSTTSTKT